LRKWRGKALLLVFFQPSSKINAEMLRYVQRLMDQHGDQELAVIGLVMSDDAGAVKRLAGQHSVTFPILAGKSLRISYDIEATPRFVVVDAGGIVRAAHTGWGPECAAELGADVKKWLPTPEPLKARACKVSTISASGGR
jgi:hypothetical protein